MKLTGMLNGQSVEVEVAELPESVISEVVKARNLMPSHVFESELERRSSAIIKNKGLRAPAELLEDNDFVQQISTKHGLRKGDTSADVATQLGQRLEAERKSWDEKFLAPAKGEAAKLKEHNDRLIGRGLQKEILRAAAEAGVKKDFLRELAPKRPAAIVAIMEGLFGYDAERDEYFQKDGDGYAISTKGTRERPYVTINEFIENWASDKANAAYVDVTSQGGPGLGKGGERPGASKDGMITLTRAQAEDAQEYARALETVKGDYSKIRVEGVA